MPVADLRDRNKWALLIAPQIALRREATAHNLVSSGIVPAEWCDPSIGIDPHSLSTSPRPQKITITAIASLASTRQVIQRCRYINTLDVLLRSSCELLFHSPRLFIMDQLRARTERAKRNISSKRGRDGWVLEKQPMTFADENSWSNRDSDVTPLDRRTWSSWTILGYWFSDVLSAQSWAGASAIIAVGLTWYVRMSYG